MQKFNGRGSQILGSVRASFMNQPGEEAQDVESVRRVSGPGRKDSASSQPEEEFPIKCWEEPGSHGLNRADRKTSYVRLPAAHLYDEEEQEETFERELRAHEILNYIKEKWDLDIDKRSSLIEVRYRTLEMLFHRRPSNYDLLKKARQQIAERTGLFSDVRKPYEFLGVPEFDNDMLIFRSLPDTVKISPDEWLEVVLRRQQEKDKQNALLPRISKLGIKSKLANYSRGRIKHGAGGMTHIERVISTGEGFQRQIGGRTSFTHLLKVWFETREEETANRGSPFGQLKRSKLEAPVEAMPDLTGRRGSDELYDDEGTKAATVDEKSYQEFLQLEKMMTAIYFLVKSMLNIKIKQLKSQNRIPHSGVIELRSRSPGSKGRRRKRKPPVELLSKFNKNTGVYSALERGVTGVTTTRKSKTSSSEDHGEPDWGLGEGWEMEEHEEFLNNFGFPKSEISMASTAADPPLQKAMGVRHSLLQFHGTGRVEPDPWDPVLVGEIYPLRSGSDLKVAVDRVQKIVESPSYLDDRPYELHSSTLRKERPIPQAERNRRYNDRFRAMFMKGERAPEPIWWDVHVRGFDESAKDIKKGGDSARDIPLKSVGNIKSNAALTIPWSDKIPDPEDLQTPELPGSRNRENLSSEEQSRLNLLAIVPEAAVNEPPSTPMRKLYEASGVQTTDKDFFQIMMRIKRPFRALEKSLRVNVANEIEKYEWDTPKRYRSKIKADCTGPIFERSIGNMRKMWKIEEKKELEAIENMMDETDGSEKRPAAWFRDLIDMCDRIRALKHQGCSNIVHKLVRYSDVNSNSKPHMLRRFCLLVVSLPANELGSPHFQKAILFLLDRLFGAPLELLPDWLHYAKLPLLI